MDNKDVYVTIFLKENPGEKLSRVPIKKRPSYELIGVKVNGYDWIRGREEEEVLSFE